MAPTMSGTVVSVCLTLACAQVTTAFEWTSASSLSNGTTVPACPGQDVTLPWSYSPSPDEHLTNVEWYYTGSDGSEVLLATVVVGNFLAIPTASQHVQFIPNSGIRLHNVAIGDTGTYSVHVNINLHGSLITEVQTVDVHVSDDPLTTDGQLHVKMLPDAVYDNSTDTFNVQLSCGDFKTEWAPKASVSWKTPPGNQDLQSTVYDNGRFLLSLPNPVVSGEYTCMIDNTSPASLCVQSDSPLKRGATVVVDGTEARFTLMDARMKAQQTEIQNLKTTHQNLTQQLETLNQEDNRLKQEDNRLKQELETLRQDNANLKTDLTSKLGTAARSVSFHARMNEGPYNAGYTLNGYHTYTNDGHAYNETSGAFNVPVSGTYIFLATITVGSDSPRKIDGGVYITVDFSHVGWCYSSYTDHHDSGSCHAILKLRAGQRVQLRNYYHDTKYYVDATFFSGALLHADLP